MGKNIFYGCMIFIFVALIFLAFYYVNLQSKPVVKIHIDGYTEVEMRVDSIGEVSDMIKSVYRENIEGWNN